MAYLNGKQTCFSPSLILEQSSAVLQECEINELPLGEETICPAEGFDGFSSVKVEGVYFSDSNEMYTKTMRVRKFFGALLDGAEHLEKLIFERGTTKYMLSGDFNYCPALKEVVFTDNCLLEWTAISFLGSNIKTLRFLSMDDNSIIDMWTCMGDEFANVIYVEVGQGWKHGISLYMTDLTAANIIDIFNKVGTTIDGVLWLGENNLLKVLESDIEIATAKGWSVM